MPTSIVLSSAAGLSSTMMTSTDTLEKVLRNHTAQLLTELGQQILLPAFNVNYIRSGLKFRSGVLQRAVTHRGARGNVFNISGDTLTVGVDESAIPYARYAFQGRAQVVARAGHSLAFMFNGKLIFRKRVRASVGHPVIFLTAEILQQGSIFLNRRVKELSASS